MAQKVWFITGSSRGFGRHWAEAALQRGDLVAATARNTDSLTDLVATYGERVLPLQLDNSSGRYVCKDRRSTLQNSIGLRLDRRPPVGYALPVPTHGARYLPVQTGWGGGCSARGCGRDARGTPRCAPRGHHPSLPPKQLCYFAPVSRAYCYAPKRHCDAIRVGGALRSPVPRRAS
jgi:hypothetical protein